jgi:hypothetical protein
MRIAYCRNGLTFSPVNRFRSRISSAHVIALVALFVALSSSATAAVMITGRDIQDGTVTSADVKDRSIAKRDLKPGVGADGEKGDPGERGPSDAFVNAYDPSGKWINEEYTEIEVATLSLPPGRFVVTGKNIVENFAGEPNFVQCTIYAGDDEVDWAWNREMPDQSQAPQAFAGTLELDAPATLSMRCKTGLVSAHVRQAMIVATQVATITQG